VVEQLALVTMKPPLANVACFFIRSRCFELTSGMSSGTSSRIRCEAALENTATPASANCDS